MKVVLKFLFLTLILVNASAEEKSIWEVQDQIDPIDDTHFVVLKLGANTEAGLDSDVVLYVRHMNGGDDVFLGMDSFAKDAIVTVRFDSQLAYKESISVSDDGCFLFFRDPMDIIEKLLTAEKLAIRVELKDNQKITSTFTIGDFAAQVEKLNIGVDWKRPWKSTNESKETNRENNVLRVNKNKIVEIFNALGKTGECTIELGFLSIPIVFLDEYTDENEIETKMNELIQDIPEDIWALPEGGPIRIEGNGKTYMLEQKKVAFVY